MGKGVRIMLNGIVKRLQGGISRKNLGRVLFALFLLSLVPLMVIALYNYPADDDFRFVLPATRAFHENGGLGGVLKAFVETMRDSYESWQGNFISVLFFQLTPMIIDVNLYFISNWIMLAYICLSVGYLVKSALIRLAGGDRSAFYIVYPMVMLLILQFMPDIGNSVYWQNGGQYTTCAMTLFAAMGMLLRAEEAMSRPRALWRGVLLALAGFILGGSFYGPMLGAGVFLALMTVYAFIRKSKARPFYVITLVFFFIAMVISVKAPGNTIRMGDKAQGVLYTILHTALDSFDLVGQWAGPQWFGAMAVIVAALWRPLRQSGYEFKHPLWVFIVLYGMFCSSLSAGIYTSMGYQLERYLDSIYFYFVIMSVGAVVYAEGALIRLLERRALNSEPTEHLLTGLQPLGRRFGAWYLAIALALVGFGAFGQTVMNVPSINATKCLITGEAQAFRQRMAERQDYIWHVENLDEVSVWAFEEHPAVFKHDRLPFQGIYGTVRYMQWYFDALYGDVTP